MANTTSIDTHRDLSAPRTGWHVVWGILLIVAGVLAVLMPGIAALATALIFGWLLVMSGVFEIVYAFQTRGHDGFGWKLASGILTLPHGRSAAPMHNLLFWSANHLRFALACGMNTRAQT